MVWGSVMSSESWANERLSKELPALRATGETQEMEYMAEFPSSTWELAKEVAAFATSNSGTILIGVADTGDLVGLEHASAPDERDLLIRRLEGICTNSVRPAVTPTAHFAVEEGKIVLVIIVPKGHEPVYYSKNTPYLRNLTQARPAQPHEVARLIRTHYQQLQHEQAPSSNNEKTEFYSRLAATIIEASVLADGAENRMSSPWLDLWKAGLHQAAAELRSLAVSDTALSDDIDQSLVSVANEMDQVASIRLHLGSMPELKTLLHTLRETLSELRGQFIESNEFSDSSLDQVRKEILKGSRRLNALNERSHDLLFSGRSDEAKEEAADIGSVLMKISFYPIDGLSSGISGELLAVGRTLSSLETFRISLDGGASLRELGTRISNTREQLGKIVDRLDRDAESGSYH